MDRLALIQILALVALVGLAAQAARRPRPWATRPDDRPTAGDRSASARASGGSRASWPLDGLGGAAILVAEAAWCDRLRAEQARLQRYGGAATVVAMHLGGPNGALARRTVRRRARVAVLARRMEAAVRATDVVRVGNDGTVRILLTETDEEGGRACAGRLAQIPPAWGVDVGGAPRLTAAWAETRSGRDLWAANRLAVARLRGASAGWLRSGAVHLDPARVAVIWPPGRESEVAVSPMIPGPDPRESHR